MPFRNPITRFPASGIIGQLLSTQIVDVLIGKLIKTAETGSRFEIGKVNPSDAKQAMLMYSGTGLQTPGSIYLDESGTHPQLVITGWTEGTYPAPKLALDLLATVLTSQNVYFETSDLGTLFKHNNVLMLAVQNAITAYGEVDVPFNNVKIGDGTNYGRMEFQSESASSIDGFPFRARFLTYSDASNDAVQVTISKDATGTGAYADLCSVLVKDNGRVSIYKGANSYNVPIVYQGSYTTGIVNASGGSHVQAITYPAGLFPSAPTVHVTTSGARLGQVVTGMTTAGATISVWNWTAANQAASTVNWTAILQ